MIVTAIDTATGVATKTTSNQSGAYEFPSLQQGNYKVEAGATGFSTTVINPVVLDLGAQVRLNLTLQLASGPATAVEVTAAGESPLLATTANVRGVIQGQ